MLSKTGDDLMTKFDILKKYFGYTLFRNGQENIIDSVLSGRDVLGIMPTGGGKSICYQLPALMMPGITIVISPLISLMKDQVIALKDSGINAAYINSTLTGEQIKTVCKNLKESKYKIVYVAPERLDTDFFPEFASTLDISIIAVDEAHCISQWGQDFRPSYMKIAGFIEKLPTRPVIAAFTATATEEVRDDIEKRLNLQNPYKITTGFDRPNLNFEVVSPQSKLTELKKIIKQRKNKSGIIYCSTRKNVEKVCEALNNDGIKATYYHAGLTDDARSRNQEDFIYDTAPVMVATNAFGMGINKSNVNYVVHYNMPMSIEAYYQEAGRAGRDGEKADCILLFSPSDIHTAIRLIELGGGNESVNEMQRKEIIIKDLKKLNHMVNYCRTTNCLRGYILDYFGQIHEAKCENCGNCFVRFIKKDITIDSQKVLSCIKRVHDKLGYMVGKGIISNVLHGSGNEKIKSLGLNKLSTYGIMSEKSQMYIREIIDYLECEGYISTDQEHGGIFLSAKSRDILFNGTKLEKAFKEIPELPAKKNKKVKEELNSQSEELYEILRHLRFELATKEKMPAYIIFSNSTLADMAVKKPTTKEELLNVSGVGSVKADKYGEEFINEINKYLKSSKI